MGIERRGWNEAITVKEVDGKPLLTGHAVVFNSMSEDLGGFREIVRPGAFKRALAGGDVRGLWSHNAQIVLGRTKSGTMRLSETERGLYYEIDPPDTQAVRDLLLSIRRGDVTGSSFGFEARAGGEKWRREGDQKIRELTDLDLYDVGPTAFPAYLATDVALRSLAAWQDAETRPTPPVFPRSLMRMRLLLADS